VSVLTDDEKKNLRLSSATRLRSANRIVACKPECDRAILGLKWSTLINQGNIYVTPKTDDSKDSDERAREVESDIEQDVR